MKRPLEPPAYFDEGQRAVWNELAPPMMCAGRLDALSAGLFSVLVSYTAEERQHRRIAAETDDEVERSASTIVADEAATRAARMWLSFLPLDS